MMAEPGAASITREELILMMSEVLKKLHARCTAQRFRTREGDAIFLSCVRAFTASAATFSQMLKEGGDGEDARCISDMPEWNTFLNVIDDLTHEHPELVGIISSKLDALEVEA